MLRDAKEIEIISRARQKNVRDPNRSRLHFERIFADFLEGQQLQGRKLLDLGPGQYDFGVLMHERGAEVHGIDQDPAVIELGRHKGFHVVEGNIKELNAKQFSSQYDGIFCKFSINALWFTDEEYLCNHIRQIAALVKAGGWAWIAPWNGMNARRTVKETHCLLEAQAEEFKALGYWAVDLTPALAKYYGIHGTTANRALFGLNLGLPDRIEACPAL